MRIAFLSPPVQGHLNPMTALARELQLRNHDVVFLSLLDAESFVRAAGLTFIPCCEKECPAGFLHERLWQLAKLTGEACVRSAVKGIAARTEAMLNSLPATFAAAGVDAVVLDSYEMFREVIPMSLGMPYVHVSNALHFDYTGYTPLCLYDWPHETTPETLARNRRGLAKFIRMFAEAHTAVRAHAERLGLKIDWDDPSATISKLAWLTQTPKEFDFESSHWPAQLHHTGPFHDGIGRLGTDFPWERLTGEPLIYASMGTLVNGLPDVFRTIAAAAYMLKDVQLVLSMGNIVDPEQIELLPRNAIIVRRAPQLELLKRGSICITHAGLNTTL